MDVRKIDSVGYTMVLKGQHDEKTGKTMRNTSPIHRSEVRSEHPAWHAEKVGTGERERLDIHRQ